MFHRSINQLAAALLVAAHCTTALAQAGDYPNKPITLQVGYQAGGSVDLVARTISPLLSKRLGQTIVIENSPGAGGTIAAGKVAIAPADGYTLLLGSPSEVGINELTNKKLRYSAVRDFVPIGLVGSQPMVLVSNAKVPAANTADFLKLVAAKPGKYMYASAGIGTPLHLAGEMLKQKAGLHLVHIPYRGAASMTTDLLGGQVEFSVFVLSSALPYIKEGRMKAIGVTSAQRSPAAPDIPSLGEDPKLKGMDMSIWFGLLAPAATPPRIVERLRAELRATCADPDVRRRLQEAGIVLSPDADFAKLLRSEQEKYKAVVDFAHITE